MKKIDILLDNGGGIQLQTAQYCHSYEGPRIAEQCADDIRAFFDSGGDTSDWDNNQPEYRRTPGAHPEERVLTLADLRALLAVREGGYSANELIIELLGFSACVEIKAAYTRLYGE